MEISKYNLIELETSDLVNISGGGERYSYYFGRFVRAAGFSLVFGSALGPLLDRGLASQASQVSKVPQLAN